MTLASTVCLCVCVCSFDPDLVDTVYGDTVVSSSRRCAKLIKNKSESESLKGNAIVSGRQ